MFTVSAFAAPYQNYTVTEGGIYPDPQAYTPDKVINSGLIGLDNLEGKPIANPQDLTQFDGTGYIILSDTGNNRIVVLDKDIRTVKQIINGFTNKDGVEQTFNSPNGVFVHEDSKTLYICDTENQRIVRFAYDEEADTFNFDICFNDPGISQYFKDDQQNTTVTTTPAPTATPEVSEGEDEVTDDNTDEVTDETTDGATDGATDGTNDGTTPDDEAELDNSSSDQGFSSVGEITYKPQKVVVDGAQRMFVVSKGCYRGMIELTDKGEFTKFFGATKTKQSLSSLLKRLFTAEAKDKLQQNLSTEYSNITIDENGFIYGTISQLKLQDLVSHFKASTEIGAALRKLNAAGTDVLKRTGIVPPSGDNGDAVNRSTYSYFCDVTVSRNGLTSVLDSQKGRIFTYTGTGELLYIFGALGKNKTAVGENTTTTRDELVGFTEGTSLTPVAIELLTDDETILVLDSTGAQITTYKPTEYGSILRSAVNNHEERRYDEAVKDWETILGMSSNSALAYRGVGKVFYLRAAETEVVNNDTKAQRETYLQAADYFMKGYSQEEYGKAFYKYRDLVLEKAMPYIMWAIIIFTVGTLIIGWYKKFKKFVETGGKRQ
jgi:hypothetical protein